VADKKLLIQVDAKVSPSVQNLNKMLDDFASRGNKVAKAFQNISGVGASGQQNVKQGGLAKALLQEKKLFDDLGKSGERLAKILNEQVTKSQSALAKQLTDSTKNLETLVKKHENAQARVERLKRGGAPSHIVGMYSSSVDNLSGQVMSAASEQQQARAALEAFKSPAAISQLKSIAGSIVTAVGGGLMVGGLMNAGAGAAQSYFNSPYAARAALGNAAAGSISALSDLSTASALAEAVNDPQRSKRMWLAQQRAGLGNVMTMLKSVVPLSGTSLADGMGAIMGFQENQAKALVQEDMTRAQQLQDMDPFTKAGMQSLQARAGGNVSMMREMGLRAGRLQSSREFAAGAGSMSIEQHDALFRAIAGRTGTAGGLAGMTDPSMFAAVRGGLDMNTVAGLSAAGQLANSNLFDIGTGHDRVLQNLVGNQVAGATLDPSRMLSRGGGAGYMAQLYAGVGGGGTDAERMRIVQQNIAGDQAFQNLASGDPLQQSQNLANAAGILGKRGQTSVLAQSKLAEVFKDPALLANVLAGGAMPGQFTGVGLNRNDVKEFANDTLRSAAQRARRFGGNTPGTKLIDKFLGGKRDFTEEQLEQMGGVLSEAAPGMFTDTTATAFFRRSGALGKGEGKGPGRTDAAGGSVELKALDTEVKTIVTTLGKLGGATQQVTDKMNQMAAAMAQAVNFVKTAMPTAMSYSQPMLFRAQANPDAYDSKPGQK
jgi:hypothetical protein